MQNSYCDHRNFDILASLNLSMKTRNTKENSPLTTTNWEAFSFKICFVSNAGGGGGGGGRQIQQT
jgi:hypothetical protein